MMCLSFTLESVLLYFSGLGFQTPIPIVVAALLTQEN
ncbi:hypothetical protein BCC1697_001837 [Burkholderia gladioli]